MVASIYSRGGGEGGSQEDFFEEISFEMVPKRSLTFYLFSRRVQHNFEYRTLMNVIYMADPYYCTLTIVFLPIKVSAIQTSNVLFLQVAVIPHIH